MKQPTDTRSRIKKAEKTPLPKAAKANAAKPKRQSKNSSSVAAKPYQFHNFLVSFYLLLMFGGFTLFLSRSDYSNARHDKFYLYLALSGVFILIAGLTYFFTYLEQNRVARSLSPFFKPVTVTDGAFLCFTIFAFISTVASAYAPGTWIAEFGRNNGMLLLLFYAGVYLLVSRLYVYKSYVIATFLISSCVVALLTALNFFYVDPLGLLNGYDAATARDFGSTIGNKNTIASYMALFLPVAMMTLAIGEKRYLRVIAGVSVVFAAMGALSANSGSVFLGLFAAVPVMMIFCAQRYDRLMRYLLALSLFLAGAKILRLFSYLRGDVSKGFESLQQWMIYSPAAYLPLVLCGGAALALFLLRDRLMPRYPVKIVTVTLISLTGLAFAGLLGVFFWFSVIDTTTPLGSLEKQLRFSDAWGTHRGVMWNKAMEEYGKFSFFGKLFGAGPDTAFYVLRAPDFEWLRPYGNTSTNCAHNEYINYLITQGLLGLLSYLAILGGVCVRAVRRAKNNPLILIFISPVICYAVQAIVNIYQPITTPLFFLFLSMTEALNRKTSPDR